MYHPLLWSLAVLPLTFRLCGGGVETTSVLLPGVSAWLTVGTHSNIFRTNNVPEVQTVTLHDILSGFSPCNRDCLSPQPPCWVNSQRRDCSRPSHGGGFHGLDRCSSRAGCGTQDLRTTKQGGEGVGNGLSRGDAERRLQTPRKQGHRWAPCLCPGPATGLACGRCSGNECGL